MRIGIIGKGGFAREVVEYLKLEWPMAEISMFEYGMITKASEYDKVLIAIGDPQARQQIANQFPLMPYTSYKNNNSMAYRYRMGTGVIICPGVVITVNVDIGDHVHLNLGCTVGHDTRIGDFTTISPGAAISGNVTIGKRCYIGSNAAIREKVTICDDVIIGAGAAVVKDITEPGTYVGVPCRKL